MTFASVKDRDDIEAEMPFAERDLPKTTWEMLGRTAARR